MLTNTTEQEQGPFTVYDLFELPVNADISAFQQKYDYMQQELANAYFDEDREACQRLLTAMKESLNLLSDPNKRLKYTTQDIKPATPEETALREIHMDIKQKLKCMLQVTQSIGEPKNTAMNYLVLNIASACPPFTNDIFIYLLTFFGVSDLRRLSLLNKGFRDTTRLALLQRYCDGINKRKALFGGTTMINVSALGKNWEGDLNQLLWMLFSFPSFPSELQITDEPTFNARSLAIAVSTGSNESMTLSFKNKFWTKSINGFLNNPYLRDRAFFLILSDLVVYDIATVQYGARSRSIQNLFKLNDLRTLFGTPPRRLDILTDPKTICLHAYLYYESKYNNWNKRVRDLLKLFVFKYLPVEYIADLKTNNESDQFIDLLAGTKCHPPYRFSNLLTLYTNPEVIVTLFQRIYKQNPAGKPLYLIGIPTHILQPAFILSDKILYYWITHIAKKCYKFYGVELYTTLLHQCAKIGLEQQVLYLDLIKDHLIDSETEPKRSEPSAILEFVKIPPDKITAVIQSVQASTFEKTVFPYISKLLLTHHAIGLSLTQLETLFNRRDCRSKDLLRKFLSLPSKAIHYFVTKKTGQGITLIMEYSSPWITTNELERIIRPLEIPQILNFLITSQIEAEAITTLTSNQINQLCQLASIAGALPLDFELTTQMIAWARTDQKSPSEYEKKFKLLRLETSPIDTIVFILNNDLNSLNMYSYLQLLKELGLNKFNIVQSIQVKSVPLTNILADMSSNDPTKLKRILAVIQDLLSQKRLDEIPNRVTDILTAQEAPATTLFFQQSSETKRPRDNESSDEFERMVTRTRTDGEFRQALPDFSKDFQPKP